MKIKPFIFKATLIGSLASTSLFSQKAFHEGSLVFDFKGELGFYNTQSIDKSTNVTTTDRAACKTINIGMDYGIGNWLSLGAQYQHNSYFVGKDSSVNSGYKYYFTPSVVSNDFSFVVNNHPLRTKNVDLVFGVKLGLSKFNYQLNDPSKSSAGGRGTTFDFHLTPRFYFGGNFGMSLNLAYVFYNYPSLTYMAGNKVASTDVISFNAHGLNLGIGLQYHFNNKEK